MSRDPPDVPRLFGTQNSVERSSRLEGARLLKVFALEEEGLVARERVQSAARQDGGLVNVGFDPREGGFQRLEGVRGGGTQLLHRSDHGSKCQ